MTGKPRSNETDYRAFYAETDYFVLRQTHYHRHDSYYAVLAAMRRGIKNDGEPAVRADFLFQPPERAELHVGLGPLGARPGYHEDQTPIPVQGFGKGRELDPIENLSRYHYLKELYLDSSTNVCVLSSVPSSPERQPLPQEEAAITVQTVNELAGDTLRCVMHAFVMPNRGAFGPLMGAAGRDPVFMNDEFEQMEAHLERYPGLIRGWKVYTPWGDVPNASGWFLDDEETVRSEAARLTAQLEASQRRMAALEARRAALIRRLEKSGGSSG